MNDSLNPPLNVEAFTSVNDAIMFSYIFLLILSANGNGVFIFYISFVTGVGSSIWELWSDKIRWEFPTDSEVFYLC